MQDLIDINKGGVASVLQTHKVKGADYFLPFIELSDYLLNNTNDFNEDFFISKMISLIKERFAHNDSFGLIFSIKLLNIFGIARPKQISSLFPLIKAVISNFQSYKEIIKQVLNYSSLPSNLIVSNAINHVLRDYQIISSSDIKDFDIKSFQTLYEKIHSNII